MTKQIEDMGFTKWEAEAICGGSGFLDSGIS